MMQFNFIATAACRRWVRWACLPLLLTAGRVLGQENYEELTLADIGGKPLQNYNQLNSAPERDAIKAMINGEQPLDPVGGVFDTFFSNKVFSLFGRWREYKAPNGKMVSPLLKAPGIVTPQEMRTRFKNEFAATAKTPAVHDRLNTLTLTKMGQIAGGNFHPVCRANAMMMIADLSDTDPGGPPWKRALPVLLSAASSPASVDVVRAPALRGLLRHAQAGIDATARPTVTTAMLNILKQRKPPEGRTQDGHDWICRRAIDVLATIGDSGPNGTVATALVDTVGDNAASVLVRGAAAAAFVRIRPPANANANNALAKTLGRLAVDAYKAEVALAAEMHQPIVVDRIKQHLDNIRLGLVGADGQSGVWAISPAAGQKQLLSALATQIDGLKTACGTPAATPSWVYLETGGPPIPADTQKPIADALAKAGAQLETVLRGGEPGAPAAAPAPGPGGLPADARAAAKGDAPF